MRSLGFSSRVVRIRARATQRNINNDKKGQEGGAMICGVIQDMQISDVMAVAIKHHGESRLTEAEASYNRVLALQADHGDALNGLALLKWQQGLLDQALHNAERAASHGAHVWRYHQTLGLIASALQRTQQAAVAFGRASDLNPESPEAWSGLGVALSALHRHEEALAALHRGLQVAPQHAELWVNLGTALAAQGASDDAIAAYTEALKVQPGHCRALLSLGNVRRARRELTAAIECYRNVLTLDPQHHDAFNNLGTALWAAGEADAALQALHRAIELRPASSAAHNNLGNVLKDTGRMDAAITAFRRAVELAPHDSQPHSNLLYSLYFHPDYDEAAILREARQWARAHAPGTPPQRLRRATSQKKLHIGYVSPDFREHCQSLFTLPLLSHHDREQFKIHCYAHVPSPDATSRRLAGFADVWRSIYGSSEAEAEATIRADGIDILVDLTMHMSNGRPLLFARRPAPLQAAWLAYPGTTGQPAIDYRFTDPWLDPVEFDDARYSEKSMRLPDTFWCYEPGDAPLPGPLPAAVAGHLTFGCLNNFCKVTDASLKLWAQVMRAVPQSRLLLLAAHGAHRLRIVQLMGGEGIVAQRIEFVPYQARAAYLATYRRIDLCLDTLPYNGHTTSLDAYWMGVPVMTRVGHTVVGRAGWSQLNNLKLPQLAALDDAQFVSKAVALGSDLEALSELRSELRERMRASPLMDAAAFAASMESLYRRMWATA